MSNLSIVLLGIIVGILVLTGLAEYFTRPSVRRSNRKGGVKLKH